MNIEIAQSITRELIERSVRPAINSDSIEKAVTNSLVNKHPLRMRMVLCPNWEVSQSGRSIGEIPVHSDGTNLVCDKPDMKIVGLLSEELPTLIGGLVDRGLKLDLLVILADILSSEWVCDPGQAKVNLKQNLQAVKLLLCSSEKGKEVFNSKERVNLSIRSQETLAGNTARYHKTLEQLQLDSLKYGTDSYHWYQEVIKSLQEMNEYGDTRRNLTGMKKIWDRALFLAAMYDMDGRVFKDDFTRAGLGPDQQHSYLGLGTVATPHGDIIGRGWNLHQPLGVVTPFVNAMEHSWSEAAK